MADDVRVTNFPSDGSLERVAYDLWMRLQTNLPESPDKAHRLKTQFALFDACISAAKGHNYDLTKIS